jgi:hypothetical protein
MENIEGNTTELRLAQRLKQLRVEQGWSLD